MMEEFMIHLNEGLVLLAIGLSVVLSFLCMLILSMYIMSKIIKWLNNLFPEEVQIIEKKGARKNVAEEEAIAIAIAVAKAQG